MLYENYLNETMEAVETDYDPARIKSWVAAGGTPPAELTWLNLIASGIVTDLYLSAPAGTAAGLPANKIASNDKIWVNSIGLFCNFADGLVKKNDFPLYASFRYEDTIGGTPTPIGNVSAFIIKEFNTMYNVGRFVGSKTAVTGDLRMGMTLFSQSDSIYPTWQTININPSFAAAGVIIMNLVVNASHTYQFT